ncbi:SDR family oxidoreductase [Spirosoma arcticum]
MTVLLTSRKTEEAQQLASVLQQEGLDVRPYVVDVNVAESIQACADQVRQEFGKLDILINNAAGITPYGERAATADLATAHAVLETTLFGTWRMCQIMLPLLRLSQQGRIVNVSSGAGSHGDTVFGMTTQNAMGTSYAVAKTAVNGLTAKLANEEKETGLLINAVCPGLTATFEGGAAMGARPVSEGATSIVWAALLDKDGPTGGFFRDGKPLPW